MPRLYRAGRDVISRRLFAAFAAFLLSISAVRAQAGPSNAPVIPAHPANMSENQLQGVSCIFTGLAAAAGAVAYSAPLAVAIEWSLPFVFAPVVAGSYAVGCSVGSTTGPGAYWLWAWYQTKA